MQSRDTVPWKVRRYAETEQVLEPAALDALSAAHDLDREDLDTLAGQLTVLLDQARRFRREDLDEQQQQRALHDLEGALADMDAGSKKLHRALKALNRFHFAHPFANTGMPNPAKAKLADLGEALASLQATQAWLEQVRESGDVTSKAPANKRKLRDERRRLVCEALFDFWIGSGRKLTYTTNTLSNAREGPLIRFVNDVVQHLTDPPAALPGEGVKSEIDAFRSAGGAMEPHGSLRRARSIDKEAASLVRDIDASAVEPSARLVLLLTTIRARQQNGVREQRAADLRLALRLAEALLERSSAPSDRAMALAACAEAKAALAQVVWDVDLLEAAAADLREALSMIEAAEPGGLRSELLLSRARVLAALDSMNDRPPSDAMIDAYTKALADLDRGDNVPQRAHVRSIIAVARARRGTLAELAAAEAHLRAALADLKGIDAPAPIAEIANNLALVLIRKAALENGIQAPDVELPDVAPIEGSAALAAIDRTEGQLRTEFARLDQNQGPADRAATFLKLANVLFHKALASGSVAPLDEAADLAALATVMFQSLGRNDAASEATVLLIDIHNHRTEGGG